MFSSLNALMLNSHANAHNDKNTTNLQNANSQQKEQTQAIVKFKGMKKRKAMKSSQKEASIEVGTSKCYDVISFFLFFFYFFIKCMQSMAMTLSRRCMYAKLHVTWSKSLLYIFSLVNHIDSLRIQTLSLNPRHRTFVFLCSFAPFAFYSFVPNSHFLVVIQVFFKYSSVATLSILMMNSVNIVSVFLS